VIITKLREVEIHDLAELVQISSVISLSMDDPTYLKQEVMVSQSVSQSISQSINQSVNQSINQSINFLISMREMKLLSISEPEVNKLCFYSNRLINSVLNEDHLL